MSLSKLWEIVKDREDGELQSTGLQSQTWLSNWTTKSAEFFKITREFLWFESKDQESYSFFFFFFFTSYLLFSMVALDLAPTSEMSSVLHCRWTWTNANLNLCHLNILIKILIQLTKAKTLQFGLYSHTYEETTLDYLKFRKASFA